ncbi:MAG: Mrp/NBP35 family ATP-binding protein [Armatimonadetes bacterium]|nr:Mrp/NBP35 family ATP-binding protein [Armatimonadota bacterium]
MDREAEFERRRDEVRQEWLAEHGPIAQALRHVRHKVAIFSGKGGVGKTSTTANLGAALVQRGYRVALYDADVHGPGVPRTLGIHGRAGVRQDHQAGHHQLGLELMQSDYGLGVISVAAIWPGDDVPVMWKGPHKTRALRQFLAAIAWGHLDFLLVDLPPGTGDEVQTIMGSIPGLDGMIVITTPQGLSTMVCSKAINAAREMRVPLLGLVENMSVFTCPHCGEQHHLFGAEKGERLARLMDVPFWGHVPFGLEVGESLDAGVPVVVGHPESEVAQAFGAMAERLVAALNAGPPAAATAEAEAAERECAECDHDRGHGHGHEHHHHEESGGDG